MAHHVLHTRTAVARLPLHQLDYLVVNWSNRVTHNRRIVMGRHVAAKEQKYCRCRIIGLCIQQLCGGSSHWLEDTTNCNRQKYFRWVGILFQGVFFQVLLTY